LPSPVNFNSLKIVTQEKFGNEKRSTVMKNRFLCDGNEGSGSLTVSDSQLLSNNTGSVSADQNHRKELRGSVVDPDLVDS
jgi:hypothetical protein